MDLRVLLLFIVTAYGKTPEYKPLHKGNPGLEYKDARGQASSGKPGFVQPLDFSTFTEQFVGEEKGSRGVAFSPVKTTPAFGADSQKSGAFQIPNSDFSSFPGPVFQKESNNTGFVQPVRFGSSFDKETNAKVYKTNISPSYQSPQSNISDQVPKASEGSDDEDEDSYFKPSNKFRHSTRPNEPKKPHPYGKSSYPPPGRKATQSGYHFPPTLGAKSKDVEMILPKDKVLFLPMVNGKPKPYDGYRAAPEGYESFGNEESSRLREKRLNEGEIIYGKPKIALSPLYHRQLKRSPAEYFGGIYPYYDYSDAKLSVGGDTDPSAENRGKKSAASNQRKKKTHPSKPGEKAYSPYKESSRGGKSKDDDGYPSGETSEEVEENSEEESEETREPRPLYKYTYDDSVKVPPLEIKTYPYEKHLRDSHTEGSKRDESYEYDDNVDEYTDGYERYVKTLPSDLETYFGSAEIDKYSVEATQNLEKNKNCKRIDTPAQKAEENDETGKSEGEAQTQICYVCSDPKTGDNYEQCAYQSQPKSQKYFFGGTTSFHTNETAEPTTYRYKRSTVEHPYLIYPYALQQSESAESESLQQPANLSEEIHKKPKKKYRKKYKKQRASSKKKKKHPKKPYEDYKEYNPFFKLQGAYSSRKGKAAKPEQPPSSYNGPKYTYEGPEETYEGPSRPYEGPKETYEGPAEPYEGPINQEYYDTVDERIRDEEEEESPKQETQGSDLSQSHYHDDHNEPKRQKPKKRQSYSSRYGAPYSSSEYYDEDDYGESYRPHGGYTSDYRFGPEHFVDEGESEDTKQTQQVKPALEKSEKRGPQKFSGPETRSASATDKQEKEEPVGEVKTFKNGDVCQKKRKEGMICMVCKNEKTAAIYEQCQYSTKPKDKYYAYGSQKSYTTKNPNTEQKEDETESESDSDSDQFPEKSDIVEKKILITTQSKVFGYDPVPTEGLTAAESNNSPRILPKDLYGDYTDSAETVTDDSNQNDTHSRNFAESIERIEPRDGIEGLEEYLYDAEDSEKRASEDEKRSYKTYDDYFHDLFPEFGKTGEPVPDSEEKEESESETHLSFDPFANVRQFHEENRRPERYSREEEEEEEEDAEASRPKELRLKDRESRIPRDFFVPYNEEQHKRDLEKALGEFQNKDWSNCKKIVKKKLTCYQCVDKNGVNNEECMYVEASQPITKHLAYHEKKEFKPAEQDAKNKTIEPATEVTGPEKPENNLRRFRKAKNSPAELIEVAEPPKDAEYVEESKGDYGGIDKLPAGADETQVVAESAELSPEQTTPKPKPKKNKRNSKKRQKTRRNETTTERFEKIRKRKFPLKKFTGSEPPPGETKPEGGSFGEKSAEETTTLAPNLNQARDAT